MSTQQTMPPEFIADLTAVVAGNVQQAMAHTGGLKTVVESSALLRLVDALQREKGTSYGVTIDTWKAVVAAWPEWSGWVATLTEVGISVEIPPARRF